MKIIRFFLAIGMAWAILQMINYQQNGKTELFDWAGWKTFLWCVLILLAVKLAWYLLVTRPRKKNER
ncbi:MAG: hypothetical protein LBD64_04910 [Odoribacteraceae bacterium]|nr:hypothetical protein [Odoribacteraceae bacterium]